MPDGHRPAPRARQAGGNGLEGAKTVFEGGVAVVTGAGSGLGEAIARRAAALGMRVALVDSIGDRVERVRAELADAGHDAIAAAVDVRDGGAVESLAERVHAELGDVRLLVNNAAVHVSGRLWEVPAEAFLRAFEVNVLGVQHGIRAFLPRMLAAGAPAFVANVTSVAAGFSTPGQAAYTASKHAVQSLSECLALELEEMGAPIHVASVLPVAVATRILDDGERHGTAEGADRRDKSQSLREAGMSPDAAARMILAQIAERRFWVTTDDEAVRRVLASRARMLSEMGRPVPPSAA